MQCLVETDMHAGREESEVHVNSSVLENPSEPFEPETTGESQGQAGILSLFCLLRAN